MSSSVKDDKCLKDVKDAKYNEQGFSSARINHLLRALEERNRVREASEGE